MSPSAEKSGAILLTGATGFLGMDALARLIERGDEQIVVLVRARDDDEARERLDTVLARLYDEPPPAAARVRAVRGDLLEPGLGLSVRDREQLISSVDRIIHCAASISFELPLQSAREINVEGVARMIELAREIAAGGSLRRLVHVSTAYVSGRHAGSSARRTSTSARSSATPTSAPRTRPSSCCAALWICRWRLRGRASWSATDASGWTPVFNVLYWPMRAFERGLLDEVPAREDSIVDFVPVDYVTDGIVALLDDAEARGTYNLVAGERALSAGELVELHSSVSGRAPVRFAPQQNAAGLPAGGETFVPYFDVRCRFDDARAREILERAGVGKPDPRDYLGRLIAYAHRTSWGKRPLSRQASMDAAGRVEGAQKTGVSV